MPPNKQACRGDADEEFVAVLQKIHTAVARNFFQLQQEKWFL